MNSSQSKIFGIGLSKTGTTSLARALEILGYETRDYLGITRYSAGDLSSINLDEINSNDAFTDTPIPSFYKILDLEYPNSKFILTIRDMDGWLKSCKKQFTQKQADKQNTASNLLFMDLYGCTVFDEQKFRYGYENFINDVLHYFKDRPQDLLILDIAAEEGWGKLSPFLGKSIPETPFPKSNVTLIRWMKINDIIDIARLAGQEILTAHEFIQANRTGQGKHLARQSGVTKSLLEKTSYIIRGGAAGIQKAARRKAYNIIIKRLKELNPRIPVISPESNNVPYSQRSKWNHFWLVDPLDGDAWLHDSETIFTVNIALIEDRKPNLGVVYAPSLDIIYYTTSGNKAFRIEHGKTQKYPWPDRKPGQMLPASADHSRLLPEGQKKKRPATMSKALMICLATEGKPDSTSPMADTMEWQTAGAHAVLHCVGMKIISRTTGEVLTYNKEQFNNGHIIIE
jgi:3'-phosphoadenosine 5'-phosphosulfate (PAPS) 3'-phosphatase